MSLPIFDQIFTGLQSAFSVLYPILIALVMAGIVVLIASSWPAQLGAVLMLSAFLFIGWAGYATYGLMGIAILFIALVFTIALYGLFRR